MIEKLLLSKDRETNKQTQKTIPWSGKRKPPKDFLKQETNMIYSRKSKKVCVSEERRAVGGGGKGARNYQHCMSYCENKVSF